MIATSPASADPLCVLRFVASFLWADLDVAHEERAFFLALARELGVPPSAIPRVLGWLDVPPLPEHVDPTRVPPDFADAIRSAALRAIAADGRVLAREMDLFELLDELLPATASAPGARAC